MKKMIFAVLAAFMVSLSFTSCSKSPEEQMIGYMEDLVSLLKDTHIKSADDVKTLAEKVKKIQANVEELQKSVGEDYESKLSEEETKALMEKMGTVMKELAPEVERLEKEAAEANVDLDDLKGLDLF